MPSWWARFYTTNAEVAVENAGGWVEKFLRLERKNCASFSAQLARSPSCERNRSLKLSEHKRRGRTNLWLLFREGTVAVIRERGCPG